MTIWLIVIVVKDEHRLIDRCVSFLDEHPVILKTITVLSFPAILVASVANHMTNKMIDSFYISRRHPDPASALFRDHPRLSGAVVVCLIPAAIVALAIGRWVDGITEYGHDE